MEIYCGNFRLCQHPTTWSSSGWSQFTDAKLILRSHENFPEKPKIVQSFHQLPSAWPRIPGSRFSDETSGKTSIYGNGPLYREVCLHHCHAVPHELSLCKRRLNLQESTSLYIRELWQRGWKHQNVLFPKNSYAFASGASHSVSYGQALISDTARVHVANKKQIIFPGKPRINYTYGECCWQMHYQFYLHVIYAGA